jgi:inner membrane protein YidH
MWRWVERVVGPDPDTVGDDIDPRLSLAHERTFLAWIRTALALITIGLAVTQLLPPFDLPGGRRIIGIPLMVLGIIVAVVALQEWLSNERAMRQGRRLPRPRLGEIVTIVIAVVGVFALIVSLVWGSA